MKKIKGFRIKLRNREILRYLKYNSEQTRLDPETEQKIQRQAEEAYSLIYPSVLYETFFSDSEDNHLRVASLSGGASTITSLLEQAYAYTVMIATVGPDLEKTVDRIKKEDLAAAAILDAAGSEAVEQCVNFVSRLVAVEAKKKECYLSMRYSPGYGDWHLNASGEIFGLLAPEKIDVSITESGILMPRKSVTAVQAWLKE